MSGHQDQHTKGRGRGKGRTEGSSSPPVRPGAIEDVKEQEQRQFSRLTGKGRARPKADRKPEQRLYVPKGRRLKEERAAAEATMSESSSCQKQCSRVPALETFDKKSVTPERGEKKRTDFDAKDLKEEEKQTYCDVKKLKQADRGVKDRLEQADCDEIDKVKHFDCHSKEEEKQSYCDVKNEDTLTQAGDGAKDQLKQAACGSEYEEKWTEYGTKGEDKRTEYGTKDEEKRTVCDTRDEEKQAVCGIKSEDRQEQKDYYAKYEEKLTDCDARDPSVCCEAEDCRTLSLATGGKVDKAEAEDCRTLSLATGGKVDKEVPDDKCVSSSGTSQQTSEEEDEDSWDKMFDDNGDCLDSSMMEELQSFVGKVEITKPKKTINYLDYTPEDKDIEMSAYSHVIEISDFPVSFQTTDLLTAFREYMARGFDIKWVDDTHALGIFSSTVAANDALKMVHPMMKLKPLSEASKQSRSKAKRCQEFLQPFKPRPETTVAAARNLVTRALGLAPCISKEQREEERKKLKEAREKKREEQKKKEDIWNGTVGACAMDKEAL